MVVPGSSLEISLVSSLGLSLLERFSLGEVRYLLDWVLPDLLSHVVHRSLERVQLSFQQAILSIPLL